MVLGFTDCDKRYQESVPRCQVPGDTQWRFTFMRHIVLTMYSFETTVRPDQAFWSHTKHSPSVDIEYNSTGASGFIYITPPHRCSYHLFTPNPSPCGNLAGLLGGGSHVINRTRVRSQGDMIGTYMWTVSKSSCSRLQAEVQKRKKKNVGVLGDCRRQLGWQPLQLDHRWSHWQSVSPVLLWSSLSEQRQISKQTNHMRANL